jgi:hypothetical protein
MKNPHQRRKIQVHGIEALEAAWSLRYHHSLVIFGVDDMFEEMWSARGAA